MGDTVMVPWKKTDQWEIRKHSPIEFPSLKNSKITYVAPKYPTSKGTDDFKAIYEFQNGIKLRDMSDGKLYLNDKYQFDLKDGDTVVLDQNWKLSVKRASK